MTRTNHLQEIIDLEKVAPKLKESVIAQRRLEKDGYYKWVEKEPKGYWKFFKTK